MSDDALTMRGPVHGTKDARKVAIGSGVGAVIETYDFIGFGTAAALYFGHAFFPGASPLAGTLASFATLGVGFAARPLGGIIGGHLGDKLGRKPVLVASLIVMGLATFVIGLLPTYAAVGIMAPILLVTVRIIQGIAFGAEWGGAILMSYEHAPWREKGRYTGMVQAGFPVGLLLANLVFLVSVHLPGDWAWRLPFLASIVLVIVGLIIRAKVPESPVFEDVKEHGDIVKSPIVKVIKEDWRNIVRGIGLRVAETAGYAVSITYMISYLKNAELATKSETLTALCIASAIGIFATMAWARLTDKIGRRTVYVWTCAFAMPVRSADVPAGEHRDLPADHRDLRGGLRRGSELDGRCPGRVVPRAVHGEHPCVGSLTGLPDFGDGVRLHTVHHHAAVRLVRLDRAGAAVQHATPRSVCWRHWSPGRPGGRASVSWPTRPPPLSPTRPTCTLAASKGTLMTLTVETGRRQEVAAAAYRMRHHVLNMGEAQGQGYVGQALGAADMLAAVYADQLRYRADDPHWEGRDRFLLSTGHYAIGLYAALAEAGIIAVDELDSYGSDGSRLPMSGMASYTPGMEISGGSLGHGLTVAVGMALGSAPSGFAVAGDQLPLRRRTGRGLDVGSGDGRKPSPAGEPDRDGRHQRAAGRRPHRRRAAHRAGRRQMGGLRLVRPARRRQRRRRAAGRLRRRRRPGAASPEHRRSSCATPGSGAACRCWRTGRKRTSCASTPTNGNSAASNSPPATQENEQS